jgi:hypothetical protein
MKNMKEQKRVYKVYETEISECRTNWQRMLPYYQQLHDQLIEIGLESTSETMADVIEFKGRESIPYLQAQAYSDAAKTGIKDPGVLRTLAGNAAERFEPIWKTAGMIRFCIETSFIPNFKRPCFSHNYLTIEGGKVFVKDETMEMIISEFFTVFAETPQQIELLELVEQSLPGINKIFKMAWNRDLSVTFYDMFSLNEKNRSFELRPRTLEFLK